MLKKIIRKIISKYNRKFRSMPKIITPQLNGKMKICHVSALNFLNAGDTFLPVVLRDLFNSAMSIGKWHGVKVNKSVDDKFQNKASRCDMVIVGGGGLFLKDTFRNEISGWQWPCSVEAIEKIKSPLVMFAVGYNRFRGQSDFEPYFTDNINAFVEKASFVGLRNSGSIEAIRGYLKSEELKQKIVFQPCMTTLTSKIYPDQVDYSAKEDFIVLNCAFDRQELRANDDKILRDIAQVACELSKHTKIKYYSHMNSDCKILPYLDELDFEYELVHISEVKQVIRDYATPRLVIGMRGHAQMIPFGCQTPILSIVSHDKLQWFLDDIGHSDWGVDVLDKNFKSELLRKALDSYNNYEQRRNEVIEAQEILWRVTKDNLEEISRIATKG